VTFPRSEKEIAFFPFCVSVQRKYSTYLSTLFDHIHSSFGIGFIILNEKGVDTRTLQTFRSLRQSSDILISPTICDFTNKPISLIQKELEHFFSQKLYEMHQSRQISIHGSRR
jgi:hypothetical protein